jgi:hypothetical protein
MSLLVSVWLCFSYACEYRRNDPGASLFLRRNFDVDLSPLVIHIGHGIRKVSGSSCGMLVSLFISFLEHRFHLCLIVPTW